MCEIVIKIPSGNHFRSHNHLEMVVVVMVCVEEGGYAWCNDTMIYCVMLITPQADIDPHPQLHS